MKLGVDIFLTPPNLNLVDEAEGEILLDAIEDEDKLIAILHQIEEEMNTLYGRPLGEGTFRVVWADGPVVYKIPNPDFEPWDGINNNLYEAIDAPNEYVGMHVAPCRIVWHALGIPIVVMEAVNPMPPVGCKARPDWSGLVDANQLGVRQNGEWAIYDAGCPPNKYRCNIYRNANIPPVFAA